MVNGKPKLGAVLIGHQGTHGGRSNVHGAVLDGYPMRYAIQAHPEPETSREARPVRKRKYFGQGGK